jgi:hypothetical protein
LNGSNSVARTSHTAPSSLTLALLMLVLILIITGMLFELLHAA